MKRPNITPGPWRQASTAQADEYTTRILAGNPARSFRVAETFAHPDADNFDEAEANARAIAAVPDLLTALAAICDASDDLRLTLFELRTAAGHLASHALLKAGYTF